MIITCHAYARAGLVGNPSDGYFGKTISFSVRNFRCTVKLWETPHFEILPTYGDFGKFDTVNSFLRDVKLHGYYGGLRLQKAIVKKFHDYCRANDIELHNRNFTLSFESDIPRLVGLAGSSAIITSTLRALMEFYDVKIDREKLPALILSAEKEELGIQAGCRIASSRPTKASSTWISTASSLRVAATAFMRSSSLRNSRRSTSLTTLPARRSATSRIATCASSSIAATPPSSPPCRNTATLPTAAATR
jgi:hypothetical protein